MVPLLIIPARAGSRGIPSKNVRPLCGRSPVERAIACAQALSPAEVIVTTDLPFAQWPHHDGVILRVRQRPAVLATDTASMVDVVVDVLKHVPGAPDQPVLLVQPTQPFRTPAQLRVALALLAEGAYGVASVVAVEPAAKLYYAGFRPVTGGSVERRQAGTATYACDGTVYAFRRAAFLRDRTFIRAGGTHMLIIDPAETGRLDTPLDWTLAEMRLAARQGEPLL